MTFDALRNGKEPAGPSLIDSNASATDIKLVSQDVEIKVAMTETVDEQKDNLGSASGPVLDRHRTLAPANSGAGCGEAVGTP